MSKKKLKDNMRDFMARMVICGSGNYTAPIGVGFSIEKADNPYQYPEIPMFSVAPAEPNFGTSSVYTDRLWQWDEEKYDKASQAVWREKGKGHYFYDRSPEQISEFLSLYFDRKVRVFNIKEGVNASSGFQLWSFQFAYLEAEKERSRNLHVSQEN